MQKCAEQNINVIRRDVLLGNHQSDDRLEQSSAIIVTDVSTTYCRSHLQD